MCEAFATRPEAVFAAAFKDPSAHASLIGLLYSLVVPYCNPESGMTASSSLEWVLRIPLKPLILSLTSSTPEVTIGAAKLISLLCQLGCDLPRGCLEHGALITILNGLLQLQGRSTGEALPLCLSLAECLHALAEADPLTFYNPSRFTLFTYEECLRLLGASIGMVEVNDPQGVVCQHILSILEGGLRSNVVFTESSTADLLSVVTTSLELSAFPRPLRSRLVLFMFSRRSSG